jgi:hypothetical protein
MVINPALALGGCPGGRLGVAAGFGGVSVIMLL